MPVREAQGVILKLTFLALENIKIWLSGAKYKEKILQTFAKVT